MQSKPTTGKKQRDQFLGEITHTGQKHIDAHANMSMEQKILMFFEISIMIIFLIMTIIIFSDRVSGMGENAQWSLGNGPEFAAKSGDSNIHAVSFSSAFQWFLFYVIFGSLQAIYLITVLCYYFFIEHHEDSTVANIYSGKYIVSFVGNLLFRILICAVLGSLIAQVHTDTIDLLTSEQVHADSYLKTYNVSVNSMSQTLQIEPYHSALHLVMQAKNLNNTMEGRRHVINDWLHDYYNKIADIESIPQARFNFISVQDIALILLLVLVPRAFNLLGKIQSKREELDFTPLEHEEEE